MDCCRTNARDLKFDPRIARRELKRFRKHGPERSTQQLLDAIKDSQLPPGPTLLDIGGGIGAIHHRLLEQGFAHATHIDASAAYLDVAAEEAERLGHRDRVAFRRGDFHELAAGAPAADVVTLDRVVCCDPDYEAMLTEAAVKARRLVAFTYPRPRWSVKLFVIVANGLRRLAGRNFFAYLHSPEAMANVLERNGLRQRSAGGTFVWAVEVFER